MSTEIVTSDSLSTLQHGFFTRKGGASKGILQGLNCGFCSTDEGAIVRINRNRAAERMELHPERLVSVHQVHSSKVVTVRDCLSERPKADALVTNTPGIGLAVLMRIANRSFLPTWRRTSSVPPMQADGERYPEYLKLQSNRWNPLGRIGRGLWL